MKININRPMRIMLISLGILFGAIFIYKAIAGILLKRYFVAHQNPVITVSTTQVVSTPWKEQLKSVGSARAIKGVNVTTELAGMVQTIYFVPGTIVKRGTVLVQLNAATEIGQLQALQAQVKLAKITYLRDSAQFKAHAVSKQQVDNDLYTLQNLQGQTASQAGTVDKKTLRAPFTGRLGVSSVNPGQYLNVGDTVVSLQQQDPIWVDFFLPQQALAQLKLGQKVLMTVDTFPGKTYTGKITTIQPNVDTSTRNVQVEATIANPHYELTPGIFTNVEVRTGKVVSYMTLPQAAVTFNPYGDIVYIVNQGGGKDEKGKPIATVVQSFVTTGETRGDQVAILTGLKEGQTVVTSGQLKLKNGSRIAINNTVQPGNNPAPIVSNDHSGKG